MTKEKYEIWEQKMEQTRDCPIEPSRANTKVCCPDCSEIVELQEGDYKYFCGTCGACGLRFGISVYEPKICISKRIIDNPSEDMIPKNCLKCGTVLNEKNHCDNCQWSYIPIKEKNGIVIKLDEWW